MLRRSAGVVALALASLATDSPPLDAQAPGMPSMPSMPNTADMMRWSNTFFVLLEQLEYAPSVSVRPVNYDARMWYGGAYQRLWLRSQGELATTRRDGEAEVELLYGRLIDPFWDAIIGIRHEQRWENRTTRRTQLEIGFLGLAPYRFDMEPTLFISQKGELSARLEVDFPIPITQRLIAEPEAELNFGLQPVPEFGQRRGLNDYEMGLRIRYEFRREVAPYIGWSRSDRLGSPVPESARPESTGGRFVAGFRAWR
jgi:copper resistance protein B